MIGDGTVGHPTEHFPLKPLESSGSGVLEIFRASGRGKGVSFGGETEEGVGGVRFGDFEETEDGDEGEGYDDDEYDDSDEEDGHQVSPLSSIPMRLLNTEGMINFAVIHREHPTGVICTGVVSDKRVQGLLPPRMAIHGRVQLAKVEEFINEVCDKGGSRFIATIRLFVQKSGELDNDDTDDAPSTPLTSLTPPPLTPIPSPTPPPPPSRLSLFTPTR